MPSNRIGPAPGPHRIPSRVTASPMMICGRSSRWPLDLPNTWNPPVISQVAADPVLWVPMPGDRDAVLVAVDGLVRFVDLEDGSLR